MNIVVVDDELNPLKNFIENVVDYGSIQVSMFMNNIDVLLDYTQKHAVDAAFLDVVMPGINGVDLAKKLVQINPKIKIVFVTGYIQDESAVREEVGDNVIGFCYKPYTREKLHNAIVRIKESMESDRDIYAQTFGVFDLRIDGKSVDFSLSKAKEMLAYLFYRQGNSVSMAEMISALWPDHDVEKSKLLYRNAKSRLDLLLRQNRIEHIVKFARGKSQINVDVCRCDLWEFLQNENDVNYNYEFLINYDWSFDMQNRLDYILASRIGNK